MIIQGFIETYDVKNGITCQFLTLCAEAMELMTPPPSDESKFYKYSIINIKTKLKQLHPNGFNIDDLTYMIPYLKKKKF